MGDAPIPLAVMDEMISFVRDTATSRYSMLASTVLYVYDLVTTLDKEVDLVWTRPRSFLQVLFIINRYLALFECLFNPIVFLYQGTNLTNSLCEDWLKFQSGTAIVILIVVQTILVIRLWAMYGRNRWVLISMTTFGALQLVASAIIMGKSISYAPAISLQPAPDSVVCSATLSLPPYLTAYWIPILAFEITLLTLMLVKGRQNFRRQNVTAVSGMTGKSLANLIVWDSIMYFVVITAAYMANAAVWYWKPATLVEAATPWGIILPPLMASKLLLNLRDAFYRGGRPHEDRSMELSTFRALERRPEASYSSAWVRTTAPHSQSQWDEWEQGNPAEW